MSPNSRRIENEWRQHIVASRTHQPTIVVNTARPRPKQARFRIFRIETTLVVLTVLFCGSAVGAF